MDHTSLDLCLRINCLNRFFAGRPSAKKRTSLLRFLRSLSIPSQNLLVFICAYCDAEDIFVSLHCNAKDYIRSTWDSAIYVLYNGTVHKNKRINRVQTGLPFLNLRKYLVAMILLTISADSSIIQDPGAGRGCRVLIPRAYKEVTFPQSGNISLVFRDEFWFKLTVTVSWYVDLKFTVLTL